MMKRANAAHHFIVLALSLSESLAQPAMLVCASNSSDICSDVQPVSLKTLRLSLVVLIDSVFSFSTLT